MSDLNLIKKVIKARESLIKKGMPMKDVNITYPPKILNKMLTDINKGKIKRAKGGLTTKKKK